MKDLLISISLLPIKLDMVVHADKAVVDSLMDLYKYTPEEDWGGGIGKRQYFAEMWEGLKDGYEYFFSNPINIDRDNQGWIEFCNDCLRCAVLYCVMTGESLKLLTVEEVQQWFEAMNAKTGKQANQELLQASN